VKSILSVSAHYEQKDWPFWLNKGVNVLRVQSYRGAMQHIHSPDISLVMLDHDIPPIPLDGIFNTSEPTVHSLDLVRMIKYENSQKYRSIKSFVAAYGSILNLQEADQFREEGADHYVLMKKHDGPGCSKKHLHLMLHSYFPDLFTPLTIE